MTKTTYEDDDRMLTRVLRDAMPHFRISPEFNQSRPPTEEQRAVADAALRRMGKPWTGREG